MLTIGGSPLSLLAHPPDPDQGGGSVELSFEVPSGLDALEAHLAEAEVTIDTPTTDEGSGRQLAVRSPDGLLVTIDELDQSSNT